MPRLRAEGAPLSSRAVETTVCAAAGAGVAALAGLLGRWSADPALGWALALGAAGAGRTASAAFAGSSDGAPSSWAAAGALAALAIPALLRAHGFSDLDPALLRDPLAGGWVALAAAAVLAAAAAAAWSRAARGAGASGAAAALAAGGAAFAGLRFADPALFLAAAALAALAAAVLFEHPWKAPGALRARAFGAAAVAGAALAALAPNLLPSIWMARLQAAYPGGVYLTLADDGTRLWAAYRFSNGSAVMLRDGVLQTPDAATAQLALLAVLGQREGTNQLLLARPPEAVLALTAQKFGALVSLSDGSPAERAVLDALGGGPEWRSRLIVPRDPAPPNAALLFSPAPVPKRGPADRKALTDLRSRLQPGAAVGVLFPAGAPASAVAAAERDAAAAFGNARVADLPKGVLVLASAGSLRTEPAELAAALGPSMEEPRPDMAQVLAAQIQWRSAPSAK